MSGDVRPTRTVEVANLVVFQIAWFAAVLGAAHDWPIGGTVVVLVAIAWHLAVSARAFDEAKLVAALCAIGAIVETATLQLGHVAFHSGQPFASIVPYWMVALWGLLALAPNVTMRWLKHRLVLAAAFGAVFGPLSFASGVSLGAAQFIDRDAALATLACTWAVLLPAVMWLSNRFDGVTVKPPIRARLKRR